MLMQGLEIIPEASHPAKLPENIRNRRRSIHEAAKAASLVGKVLAMMRLRFKKWATRLELPHSLLLIMRFFLACTDFCIN